MCGICGIYSPGRYKKEAKYLLPMRSLLLHRGPDSQGLYENDNVGLAVCRLSIVDVSGSNQPLFNEDRSLVLVYNGMIYNFKDLKCELEGKGHRFRTMGDGEVILHLYEEKGVDCFKLLHGMFAVCIFDLKKNSIVLARDHFGIKPLYFYHNAKKFLFSSEIKAIIKTGMVKDALDLEGLNLYFYYNYIPGQKTIYKDISSLLPGHFMILDKALSLTIKPFWNINEQKNSRTQRSFSIQDVKDDLEGLLQDSIRRHIQSDVEVGCFLSGGLDSSSIVHFLSQNNHSFKTFSVGYDNKYYDERDYSRLVSKAYKTDHTEIVCREKDVIQFLEDLPEIGDSIVADQSIVSTYLVSRAASKYVKVCLSGEGGDELFLGYPTYRADFLYQFFKYIPFSCLDFLEKAVSRFPSSDKKLSFDYKLVRFIKGLKFKDIKQAHPYWRVIFTTEDKRSIFKPDIFSQMRMAKFHDIYFGGTDVKNISLESCASADLNTWLSFNNLLRTDIYSMRNSLEVRVPFLHLPLVEYVTKLPFNIRFKILKDKYLLKELMRGKLDRRIIERKKEGWHMPLASWLKSDLFDYCYDIFNSKHKVFDSIINRKECINLLFRHKNKKENNSFKIWGLLVFLKYIRP